MRHIQRAHVIREHLQFPPGKTVKAVAVCNKYADSSVSSKKLAKLTTYKITFKGNGGKGSMSKQSMAKGVSTAISKISFRRNIIRLQAGIPRQTEKVSLIKTKQRSSSRRTLHCMHSGNLRNIRLPIN